MEKISKKTAKGNGCRVYVACIDDGECQYYIKGKDKCKRRSKTDDGCGFKKAVIEALTQGIEVVSGKKVIVVYKKS